MSPEDYMRLALEEADRATSHGDVPVGAVVVSKDGVVLAREHNRREQDSDPTAHAELLAIREASRHLSGWRLEGATVYVTLEPCCMCAGALVNARIARLVYGATDPKAGAIVSLFQLGSDTRLNHRFEIEGGLLDEEGAKRLSDFFAARRLAKAR
ncbi:MAG TPA: tRNA adenosine(34) deaminase TadA [Polyangiaceae bacterium]|nr:tRNA adenosine(34) deaminase TadA [Polyangiaceae bacterium]